MIDSYVILTMPFNFILNNNHLYYRNTQCFLMAMPLNVILVLYVILERPWSYYACNTCCDYSYVEME